MLTPIPKPKVSIAILFYNQEKYVNECLDSVVRQKTTVPFEIVIADDCSTDGTRALLSAYQQRYPTLIRLIFNDKNKGLLLNRKVAYDNCRGKYIALLDGDDYFLGETRLQEQFDYLEANPEYGVVYGDQSIIIEQRNGTFTYLKSSLTQFNHKPIVGEVYENLVDRCFVPICTSFVRKELIDKYLELEEWKRLGFKTDDYPMWLALSRVTKFGFINKPLTVYRHFVGTISNPKDVEKALKYKASCFQIVLYFLKMHPVSDATKEKFLTKYHTFHIDYAFYTKDTDKVKESLEYFKQSGRDSFLFYWYYFSTTNIWLWWMLRFARRYFSAARLRYPV